jgi:hypothetical protein
MPAELFTKKVSDVITRVKTQFGDTSGAQINDETIIRWINDGQQEIVNNNSILKDTKLGSIVANQAEYTFPLDKVQYIEALYVEGRPIKNLSPQGARDFILATDPTLAARGDYPELWYERGGVITLYPVPQKSFPNGLKMEYVKMPAQVSGFNDTLSIPDRYVNQLVNYCMVQALEYDENYSAAQLKLGQFRDGLDRLHYKENISQSDLYPVISPDPADYV